MVDDKCINQCPEGITIQSTLESGDPACLTCTSKCKTCSGKTDFCTSCTAGFILDEEAGRCVKECSSDNTRVEVNGKCVDCEAPCSQCQNRVDYCLACQGDLIMHDYLCVDACPEQYSKREDGRCILTGLFCPFGYDYNDKGDACTELIA